MNAKYSKVTLDTTTAELWTNRFYLPKKQCKQNCTDLNKPLKAVSHYICSAWLFGSRCSQSAFVSHLYCQVSIKFTPTKIRPPPPQWKRFQAYSKSVPSTLSSSLSLLLGGKTERTLRTSYDATMLRSPTRSCSLRKRKLMALNHTSNNLPVQLFGHEWATEWLVFYVHQCYTC